jgi:hypothetical protein
MGRVFLAALLALCLSACAPFHKSLTAESRTKIREVDVRVVVAQETFMFTAQSPGVSAAMGGGLIPALIDAGIQQSRQKDLNAEIEAVVDPLLAYDFRAEAKQALGGVTGQPFPLKLGLVQVLPAMPTKAQHEARIAATRSGPAYMVLTLQYALEPGLGAFTTRTTATLWQDGAVEPSYRTAAIFQAPLEGGQRAEVIKRLTADDGLTMRTLMRDSVTETLRMVAIDIGSKSVAAAEGPRKSFVINLRGTPSPVNGATLDDQPARVVVRDQIGALYSLRKVTP